MVSLLLRYGFSDCKMGILLRLVYDRRMGTVSRKRRVRGVVGVFRVGVGVSMGVIISLIAIIRYAVSAF